MTKQFDEIAHVYDETLPEHVARHYLEKRTRFLSRLGGGRAILDVCSGTGKLSEALLAQGRAVYSLDLSRNMLLVRKAVPHYRPVNGSALALPFKDAVFDMTLSVAAMHHIATPERVASAIIEMQRVTRRGGAIVIWDHNPGNPYWHILMKKVPQDTGEERLIPAEELKALFPADSYECRIWKLGFMPDFVPKQMLGIFRVIESLVERLPLLRLLAAHNVLVARKY
ncbi:MAG: hypothetical protein OHK006_12420 [Thermodesulfovibrionales bacterium]